MVFLNLLGFDVLRAQGPKKGTKQTKRLPVKRCLLHTLDLKELQVCLPGMGGSFFHPSFAALPQG